MITPIILLNPPPTLLPLRPRTPLRRRLHQLLTRLLLLLFPPPLLILLLLPADAVVVLLARLSGMPLCEMCDAMLEATCGAVERRTAVGNVDLAGGAVGADAPFEEGVLGEVGACGEGVVAM